MLHRVSTSRPLVSVILAMAAVLTIVLLSPFGAAAHAQLYKSSPPADALLAAPPRQIDLYFSERVAKTDNSPGVKVLDENGAALKIDSVTLDAATGTHATATVSGIATGTYTVVWTTTSADDGHTLSGSFSFRVGGADRAPGAATTEGQRPRAWAVALRWITFLGAGIAAAALFFRAIGLFGSDDASAGGRRRMGLAALAALVALVATVLEPFFQSQFPAAGTSKSSFEDALSALPSAWWLRAPGLIVSALLALGLLRVRLGRPAARVVAWVGGAAGLIAILGLALTTHTAARSSWRLAAIASVTVHEWGAALWAGGLVCLAISLPTRTQDGWADGAIRTFSKLALASVVVLGAAGLVNAGLIFPSVASVWQSDFGRVLIAKSIILLPALGLAARHRLAIRRGAAKLGQALRPTIRVESAFAVLVVLGGVILALVAPPVNKTAGGTATSVDLAAQLSKSTNQYVRFQVTPGKTGPNTVTAFVTDGIPVAYNDQAGAMVSQPPMTNVVLLRITLTSLDHATPAIEQDLAPAGGGIFRSTVQFGLNDWWQVGFTIRRLGVEDETAMTFLMLPDPNVNGFDAPKTPKSDPSAESLFQRGLANLTSIHSVRYAERLGGGVGTFTISEQQYRDDSFGAPAAMQIDSPTFSQVRMNGEQWLKTSNGAWQQSDAGPILPFSSWGDDFNGAVGFQLGITSTLNSHPVQVISFFVPGTTELAPAWYSWWVATDTGQIERLTMISRGHYMERDYLEYNQPLNINPPGTEATPIASPVATPAA